MTPRWLVIEKLVVELGEVCSSHSETRVVVDPAAVRESGVEEAVDHATEAVTAVLQNSRSDDEDATVRTAWEAIARAQDAIRALRHAADRSRALCDAAQILQDQSLRLRRGPR